MLFVFSLAAFVVSVGCWVVHISGSVESEDRLAAAVPDEGFLRFANPVIIKGPVCSFSFATGVVR